MNRAVLANSQEKSSKMGSPNKDTKREKWEYICVYSHSCAHTWGTRCGLASHEPPGKIQTNRNGFIYS